MLLRGFNAETGDSIGYVYEVCRGEASSAETRDVHDDEQAEAEGR